MSGGQTRLYVGNLPRDVRERELDDLFYKYGRIRSIDIPRTGFSRDGSVFAFVEFEHPDDAYAAQRRDGIEFDGGRLRVELARGRGPRGGGGEGGRGGRERGNGGRPRTGPGNAPSEWKVLVSNLPPSASWQDLKDWIRKVDVDVSFTDVDPRKGEGTVEFLTQADMDKVLDRLDNTEFSNPFDRTTVRVRRIDGGSGGGSGAGGASREDRGRSRSRSPPRGRSRSRSRSRSPRGGRSVSRSRSRDRSESPRDRKPRAASDADSQRDAAAAADANGSGDVEDQRKEEDGDAGEGGDDKAGDDEKESSGRRGDDDDASEEG